jgi:anti-sigma B factor antagonist
MEISERKVGAVVVLDLKGKITLGTGSDELREKIESLIQQGAMKILLNMAEVPYVDSSGVQEIVRSYATVLRKDGSLKLLNLSERMHELLKIMRLSTVLEIFIDEAAALASFEQ